MSCGTSSNQPKRDVHQMRIKMAFEDRPTSQATEFEEDESDDEQVSRKSSFESYNSRRHSGSSASTLEEAVTPQTELGQFEDYYIKPIRGPQGPHLFYPSRSFLDASIDSTLQLSPLEARSGKAASSPHHGTHDASSILPNIPGMPVSLWDWTCENVSDWMYSVQVETQTIGCFRDNDITGAILAQLSFDDLKDLGIQSFGKRHTVWGLITSLKNGTAAPSPALQRTHAGAYDERNASTGELPLVNEFMPASTEQRFKSAQAFRPTEPRSQSAQSFHSIPARATRGPTRQSRDDQLELLDCVGLEYVLPKEHKCAKGQACKSWQKWHRRAQRAEQFDRELRQGMPMVEPESARSAHLTVAGRGATDSERLSPLASPAMFEGVPSMVASSDVMGPEQPALALQESAVSQLDAGSRDPLEHVKQYLHFQHVSYSGNINDVNGTVDDSRHDIDQSASYHTPTQATGDRSGLHAQLRRVPRLVIPTDEEQTDLVSPISPSTARPYSPGDVTPVSRADTAIPYSPERVRSPCNLPPRRAATADPYLTASSGRESPALAIPIRPRTAGPAMREPTSHHRQTRSADPSPITPVAPAYVAFPSRDPTSREGATSRASSRQALRRPSLPVLAEEASPSDPTLPSTQDLYGATCTKAGPVRKRHTRRIFLHDWTPAHVRLHGTRLAVHSNARAAAEQVEEIDVQDYAVTADGGRGRAERLIARMRGRAVDDGTEFAFQLVPERRLGKTHHFQVGGRGERMDWVREMMLAKARGLGEKGYEVQHAS